MGISFRYNYNCLVFVFVVLLPKLYIKLHSDRSQFVEYANCILNCKLHILKKAHAIKMQIIYPNFRLSYNDSKYANDLIDVVFKSPWWNSRGIKCVSFFKFRISWCRDYMIICYSFPLNFFITIQTTKIDVLTSQKTYLNHFVIISISLQLYFIAVFINTFHL